MPGLTTQRRWRPLAFARTAVRKWEQTYLPGSRLFPLNPGSLDSTGASLRQQARPIEIESVNAKHEKRAHWYLIFLYFNILLIFQWET